MDSSDYSSLIDKGISLQNLGFYVEAIECFDKALKIEPDNIQSLMYKSSSLGALNRQKEAIKCLNILINSHPELTDFLVLKGHFLTMFDRNQEAIKCFNQVLKTEPDDVESLKGKGISLSALDRDEEAIEYFNKALKLEPDDVESLRSKGTSLNYLEKYKKAIKCFDKALKLEPDDIESLRNKGISLSALDRDEEAIEYFDKALKLEPDNDFSLKWRNHTLQKLGINKHEVDSNNESKIQENDINQLKTSSFEYDVAISYAKENQEIVEQIALKLTENNVRVFYDAFEKSRMWGKKLSTYFRKTFGEKACFVLVFVSKEYSIKDWTSFEFKIARDEAKIRQTEFILPVRLDNTVLFGLPDDIAHLSLKTEGIEGIVNAIIDKLND